MRISGVSTAIEYRKQVEERFAATRGWTPEQVRAAHTMDALLDLASRGEDVKFPIHGIAGIREYTLHAQAYVDQALSEAQGSDDQANMFATMRIALDLLLERLALDQIPVVTPAPKQDPSAVVLCNGCRDRIDRGDPRRLDSTTNERHLRIYIPTGHKHRRRAAYIRAAWEIARQHRLFSSRTSFANYAGARVGTSARHGVGPRSILEFTKDMP